MNLISKIALSLLFATITCCAKAQDTNAGDMVKQGVELQNQGKYAEAIEKYKEALKADPENTQANYQMGFSLFASGKGMDGVPFVEKAIKNGATPSFTASAYDLLGSIYDQANQSDKSIDAYKSGIKVNPNYQRLHFNLGIAYSRYKKYAEAEQEAIEAIKLDPKHASSQRLYALVTFHQNKRLNALLAFCSFIALEPNTPRSTEAYTNIQSILKGGTLKDAVGRNTIIISPKDKQDDAVNNMVISVTASVAQKTKLTGVDLLGYELQHIFSIAGQSSKDKTDKTFFEQFFVVYFYKLAQSDNMQAFAHMVDAAANKEANEKWATENAQQVTALSEWLQKAERGF
ncbi:MAG TPA: tetratricopeptide repeat protein [Mucilaginibacter sp.]|nr:tetratricopeptide repeat protein [Mucilaginibacter sp.]